MICRQRIRLESRFFGWVHFCLTVIAGTRLRDGAEIDLVDVWKQVAETFSWVSHPSNKSHDWTDPMSRRRTVFVAGVV